MAGKAVAVAKAVVKKPVAKATGKAKKPTAKATGKVVAKAAKKPATGAKKPAVAKFNLNKLMMLIVRDAPKKGKKMMGGYKDSDISTNILNIIKTFIHINYNRIAYNLDRIDKAGAGAGAGYDISDPPPHLNDIHQIIEHINSNSKSIKVNLNRLTTTNTDSLVYIRNYMRIVIVLCETFCDFKRYSTDFATDTNQARYDIL